MNRNDQEPLKITVVGDHTVGKTSLSMAFKKASLIIDHLPKRIDSRTPGLAEDPTYETFTEAMLCFTEFHAFYTKITVDGVSHDVSLWDTHDQREYDRLRQLSYSNTDVFLLLYAVDNVWSLNNLTTKWIPELRHHCPTTPIVFVGNKVDIRKKGTASGNHCVSYNEGLKVSKEIGTFIEVSAKTGENLEAVFEEAVRVALNIPKKAPPRGCTII